MPSWVISFPWVPRWTMRPASYHQDLVGVPHRLQPAGNEEDRLLVGQCPDGLHQLLLVLRIHVSRGLVQE